MIYVIFSKEVRPYISAVFSSTSDAESYFELFPKEYRDKSHIEQINHEYPVYLTEDINGFNFHTQKEIEELLNNIQITKESDDFCYTNLYRITRDFSSKYPGKDAMGFLQHWHINNNHLSLVKKSGIEALFNN